MSFQEKFKEILNAKDFGQLEPYIQPTTWKPLSRHERELLAILFVKQGEHQLQQGNTKWVESFDLASKVSPKSATIPFLQALAYSTQGQNINYLNEAKKALEKAIFLDPFFIKYWHSLGNVLTRIGVLHDNPSYFFEAEEKFSEASKLIVENGIDYDSPFFWHWGVCLYYIAKHSGEISDFIRSLEKFRLADDILYESAEFHNDFGNVLVDIASLMSRKDLYVEGLERYKKAAKLAPAYYESWLNMACIYQRLYEESEELEHFYEADECFERALQINTNSAIGWLRWAELYTVVGKLTRDIERVKASFEKFEQAAALEPNSPHILLRWGEAQTWLASSEENLNLLREAESKICFGLESLPDEPDAWHIYGCCLMEFGRYFNSESYYTQAIEKFQQGLAINSTHCSLLQGMALAHFALGEMKVSLEHIKKAVHYFQLIKESGEESSSQFLSDWGISLMKLGEMTNEKKHVEAAAEKFEQAISWHLQHSPKESHVDLEWLYNYGCAMDYLGDFHEDPSYYEKAVQILSHVLRIDPAYSHAKYNLALALFHLGELNADVDKFYKAIDLFHQLIEEDPEDEIAWNDYGLALLNLAFLTIEPTHEDDENKLFAQAESKLLQSVALGSIQAFYNLACLHALVGNINAALSFLEKAEHHKSLPSVDDIIHDEWLENLHDVPAFRLFISRLLSHQERANDSIGEF